MIAELEDLIHKNVNGFLEETAKEFDIPMAKLKEKWRAHLGDSGRSTLAVPVVQAPGEPKKKTVKKSSQYQNFFVQKRAELVRENPTLQFGDLSSRISKLWNNMTKEEQKGYAATTTIPCQGTTPGPVLGAPAVFDFDSLNSKNMPELRKLCEEKGLKRTGNKLQLINNLLGLHTEAIVPPHEVKKAAVTIVATQEADADESEDVEVVVAKNMKRADIEEEAVTVLFSDDEQDFDFEEGSNYSVNLEDDD